MGSNKEVIVITGSSGRIGSRLIERLGRQTDVISEPIPSLIGMDCIGTYAPTPSCECIYVDLTSDESVRCAFDRIRYAYGDHITAIIHLAAYYSFEDAHLERYETITVQGTQRLLRAAQAFTVDLFIFMSTLLVYEPCARGVILTENSPVYGQWPYPASKIRTEKVIREEHGKIPYVILRAAGCYDEQCHCIPLAQQIARIYEKQLASLLFPGKSSHGVPYVHFDDLIDLMILLITKRADLPKTLLLLCCEEDAISYRDLQTALGYALYGSKKWPMWWIPKWLAKAVSFLQNHLPFTPKPFIKPWMIDFSDDNYQFSMDYTRRLLNWSPKRSLRQTIPLMAKDLLRNPLVWYQRHHMPLPRHLKKRRPS